MLLLHVSKEGTRRYDLAYFVFVQTGTRSTIFVGESIICVSGIAVSKTQIIALSAQGVERGRK